MFLFDLFRSYLPLHNPIGFGGADFIEFALAACLTALILLWRRIVAAATALSEKPRLAAAFLFSLPIAMRLALLPHYPVPTPNGSDDFSYLLLADTLRHFRLANPVHPMHKFFEAIFVLQEPSYSSIFPLGQGIVLILGWGGVLITAGVFCVLVFWMLLAWVPPVWALLGGLLAVAEFGPLCVWMNDYWGGFVSASAGCLVFGSLPRLQKSEGILLGLGIALQWLTRPFECLLLLLATRKFRVAMVAPILVALGLTALQNHAVTGTWTKMPYMLSREQYGVPASFTIQPNPVPNRPLTAEQKLDYDAQSAVHGPATDTVPAFWQRLVSRLSFYRFFLLVPLFIAPLFLLAKRPFLRVFSSVLIFAIGTNFYPYFYPHYIAAEACLFVLLAVAGLATMPRELAKSLILLCAVHAILWYGLHLAGSETQRVALMRFENWDFVNYGDPEGRIAINRQLDSLPGRQLIFVRYGPAHGFHEWIHNGADIDASKVVWAGNLGEDADRELRNYYPDRKCWIVEPDSHRASLAPCQD